MTHYHVNTAHALDEQTAPRVETLLTSLKSTIETFKAGMHSGVAPLLKRPFVTDDLHEIQMKADHIRENYKQVIICGSGGSGLSGKTLTQLNLGVGTPSLHYLENIDPDAMDAIIRQCTPADAYVIIISKSGTTAETVSQFYVLLAYFKKTLGENAAKHFLVITMKTYNPMRKTATDESMAWLEHPADIGGRFCVFTVVGLLPAAIAGMDIKRIRKGAANTLAHLDEHHPAAVGAAIQYAHMEKNRTLSVLLTYSERLSGLNLWYRQCWAESLGKGGKGTLPVPAMGTTDQHSQLQLYLDGPADKFFTLIFLKRFGTGQLIPAPEISELEYLRHKTTGDLMGAQQQATLETLTAKARPVRLFTLEKLAEEEIGALLMHFTLEVLFMAALLGVDALNQPAVEDGKILAREALLAL